MTEGDQQPEEDKTNSIPISNFKSNKLSHIDKKHRAEDFEKMIQAMGEPGSPTTLDVIRLPNKVSTVGGASAKQQQEIMSPTLFFGGGIGTGTLENFFNQDEKNSV